MKKLATLLLAAGLVFSSVSGASAADLKVGGEFMFSFGAMQGMNDLSDNEANHFEALQRVRMIFNYVASETLSGTVRLQLGSTSNPNAGAANWGSGTDGANLASSMGVKVNWAYLDWMVPGTEAKVRMGLQGLGGVIPTYVYNNVISNRGTGVVVSAPIANTNLTAAWVRANANMSEKASENDIFALAATANFDGFKVSPWFMYALSGDAAGTPIRNYTIDVAGKPLNLMKGDAWALGLGGQVTMFDPFTFAMDVYFSQVDPSAGLYKALNSGKANGWYADAALSYKTAYGTPALKGWYASGDKSDKLGQPISLAGSGFAPTSTMFDNAYGLNSTPDNCSAYGTYGIVLEWADVSFMENLSHTARVAYVKGTNNDHGKFNMGGNNLTYMTTQDSFVEADLNTTYQIYKNLAAVLELAYVWADFQKVDGVALDDGYRASLTFAYNF